MTQFNPAMQHRALGTWLCFLLFLSLVFHETGDDSPLTAILPFIHPRPKPHVRTWIRNDALVGILVPAAVVFLSLLLSLARLVQIDFVHGRTPTSSQPLNEPSEPQPVVSPLLEEKDSDDRFCYPVPSVSQVECEPVEGYMLDFTEGYQAEEEESFMDLSEPADVSPDVDTHHPETSTTSRKDAVEGESLSCGPSFHNDDEDVEENDGEELLAPIKHCPLASRIPAAPLQTNQPRYGVPLELASQVSAHPSNSVRVEEKAEELEDSSALDPQARGEPNGTGTDPSAQVSGTAPDAGSLGAFKPGFASSLASKPRKPHDSDAALSAQVSGTASKTGFLGNLRVKCKAAAASAKRSWVIVQASLGRIKNAGKRGFKSKNEREMEKAYRTWLKGKWREVDSDSEDVADSVEDDGEIDEGGFFEERDDGGVEAGWGAWPFTEPALVGIVLGSLPRRSGRSWTNSKAYDLGPRRLCDHSWRRRSRPRPGHRGYLLQDPTGADGASPASSGYGQQGIFWILG